jgi:hypothetical protein
LLGKLEAFAEAYFSWEAVENLASKPSSQIWRALAMAFDLDEGKWVQISLDRSALFYFDLVGSYALYPLKVLNIDLPAFSREGLRIEHALRDIRKATNPTSLMEGYHQLFNTNFPSQFAETLVRLTGNDPLPIIVGFKTEATHSPKDSSNLRDLKKEFDLLNGKIFQSRWPLPEIVLDLSADEKMSAFENGGHRTAATNLFVDSAKLILEAISDKNPTSQFRIEFRVPQKDQKTRQNWKVYIRLESYTPLLVGRNILSEEIFNLEQHLIQKLDNETNVVSMTYSIPLAAFFSDKPQFFRRNKIDGTYDLYVGFSEDGDSWAQERRISFRIENGLLRQ